MQIKKILVVGAGTMGSGIAQWFTQQDLQVELMDIDEDFAGKSLVKIHASWDKLASKGKFTIDQVHQFKQNLKVVTSQNVSPSQDLLVEAIVENLAVKKAFFKAMDEVLAEQCYFASNTSSFPITSICQDLPEARRQRFLGLHFFNPATIMKLVEVIRGSWTSEELAQDFSNWFASRGKQPALCGESPGFIVNRVARNFYGEALRIAETDDPKKYAEIDRVMREVGGFKMGPYQLMDLIGIDINYDVTQSVWKAFNNEPRFAPHALQKKMVESGRLGKKSGEGFYHYE